VRNFELLKHFMPSILLISTTLDINTKMDYTPSVVCPFPQLASSGPIYIIIHTALRVLEWHTLVLRLFVSQARDYLSDHDYKPIISKLSTAHSTRPIAIQPIRLLLTVQASQISEPFKLANCTFLHSFHSFHLVQ
jgi:hypothetical protein